MQKLAVIDLDKTFINVDSSLYFIYKYRIFSLLFWGILRKLGLISRIKFAERIGEKMDNLLTDSELNMFVKFLKEKTNDSIIQKINELKRDKIKVILVSGTPDLLVKKLAADFEFEGFGSHKTSGGKYIHLYGKTKLEYVYKHFPKSDFDYYFTVSDSMSDKYLFDAFKNSYLFVGNKFNKLARK